MRLYLLLLITFFISSCSSMPSNPSTDKSITKLSDADVEYPFIILDDQFLKKNKGNFSALKDKWIDNLTNGNYKHESLESANLTEKAFKEQFTRFCKFDGGVIEPHKTSYGWSYLDCMRNKAYEGMLMIHRANQDVGTVVVTINYKDQKVTPSISPDKLTKARLEANKLTNKYDTTQAYKQTLNKKLGFNKLNISHHKIWHYDWFAAPNETLAGTFDSKMENNLFFTEHFDHQRVISNGVLELFANPSSEYNLNDFKSNEHGYSAVFVFDKKGQHTNLVGLAQFNNVKSQKEMPLKGFKYSLAFFLATPSTEKNPGQMVSAKELSSLLKTYNKLTIELFANHSDKTKLITFNFSLHDSNQALNAIGY